MRQDGALRAALAAALLAGAMAAPAGLHAAPAKRQDAADKPAKPAPKPTQDAPSPEDETEHLVRPGETLGGIAQRAKVPRILIIEANHLVEPYALRSGQKLYLPRTRHHIVKAGETGFDIAYRYGVPLSSITVANGLKPDSVLKPGQKLLIPSMMKPDAAAKAPAPRPRPEGKPASAEADSDSADNSPTSGRPPVAAAKPARTSPAHADTDTPDTDENSPPRLVPPLAGQVRRGFAPREGGDPHDGVDIVADEGAAVRAAAGGKVIFAGREPQSFGNLVVIDHGDGWQTAYGFLSKVTVAQGDAVKQRERVGLVGHTGKATRDEVHFELRHANAPVDPARYMPALRKAGPAKAETAKRETTKRDADKPRRAKSAERD